MQQQNRQCILLLNLVLLLHQFFQTKAHVPAIIVFGDSSVDTGNNNYIHTIAKSNFEPYGRDFYGGQPTGRFCNGRLATDFISEAFKLPPVVPAFLDDQYTIEHFSLGVCFASAATGFDNATANILSVIPLSQQLEYYKQYQEMLRSFQGEAKASETIREALYIISLGTNDFIENYYAVIGSSRSKQFTTDEYVDFIVGIAENFVRDIYRLGARKIEVAGISPFGCLPQERVTNQDKIGECKEDYNIVAQNFNMKLSIMVDKLNKELFGVKVVFAGLYDLFLDVVRNPKAYGFENSLMGCCGTGLFEEGILCNHKTLTCPDASKYVFWDAVHPTERMYQIIADYTVRTALSVFL
ncbi:GDSL esterase/lipase [Rhynchospora pubera]|uniref:GDSL esterase/lipase n=2 Tax=Rhynchospora pubera TaxID=906938 RepID=A0AAV8D9L3_9POAL|nr:GDSL esterase/lipase [Rhynchospora pubera]